MKKQYYRKKQVGVILCRQETQVANSEEVPFLALKRVYFIFVYGTRTTKTAALDATMACVLVTILLG